MNPVLLALLHAVRSAAAALIFAIDQFAEALPVEEHESTPTAVPPAAASDEGLQSAEAESYEQPGPCPHPEDKRRQMPVMGSVNRFLCIACNDIVD